jgi:hypothetical protein
MQIRETIDTPSTASTEIPPEDVIDARRASGNGCRRKLVQS